MVLIILNSNKKLKDANREQVLEEMGLSFLRFSEQEIRKDMDVVLKAIENYIAAWEEENKYL